MLEFDHCSVLRQNRRVRVRGVDVALIESWGPREVPEHVFLFRPIQHSGTRGPSITNDVAIQYSRHAWGHSFHLFQGFGFITIFVPSIPSFPSNFPFWGKFH